MVTAEGSVEASLRTVASETPEANNINPSQSCVDWH